MSKMLLWVLCQIQHLGGKQREFEFIGLTPDTEFLGTIVIFVPTWSKESAPYMCRVKTLPGKFSRSRREVGLLNSNLDSVLSPL